MTNTNGLLAMSLAIVAMTGGCGPPDGDNTLVGESSVAGSVFGQPQMYRNLERINITSSSPLDISPGPCWEGIRFVSGFMQNNFQAVYTTDGVQVTWTSVMHLNDGVGATSGQSYSAKQNFQYVYHLQQGQYSLPQRRYFRLIQEATGAAVTVVQAYIIRYDPETNSTKVLVDRYDVSCP
jgi:hypothetical protein